jgi:hypothetical protein
MTMETSDRADSTPGCSSELGGRGTTLRENLAEALALCLDLDDTIGKTFSLLDGDIPIESALRSL